MHGSSTWSIDRDISYSDDFACSHTTVNDWLQSTKAQKEKVLKNAVIHSTTRFFHITTISSNSSNQTDSELDRNSRSDSSGEQNKKASRQQSWRKKDPWEMTKSPSPWLTSTLRDSAVYSFPKQTLSEMTKSPSPGPTSTLRGSAVYFRLPRALRPRAFSSSLREMHPLLVAAVPAAT